MNRGPLGTGKMMAYRDLLYLRNILYMTGGMMESQLDKTYYEGIFGSGAITPEVLAEMDAQASRLVDELAQANAEISALKRTAMRASVAIAERDATIERLRSELEAEQARTICYTCGKELAEMAQPKRIEPQPIADVCETWWFGDKYFLNDELLIAHLGQLGNGTPCLIDGVWWWEV